MAVPTAPTQPLATTLTITLPPSVAVGGTLQASVAATPSSASVTWSSETPAVAQVSTDGKITGVTPGQAIIRATAGDVSSSGPVTVFPPFVDLALGSFHACGLTATGTIYCWGNNSTLQLGIGGGVDRCSARETVVPCSLTPRPMPTALTFSSVSGTYANSCGLTAAGDAYCWGDARLGQLGPTTERCEGLPCTSVPVKALGDVRFSQLGAGQVHACALDAGGKAYCWGVPTYGNLGAPRPEVCQTPVCALEPLAVSGGLVFDSLSVGDLHSCGLTPSGQAYCWGWNAYGQLGNGEKSALESGIGRPVTVSGGRSFAVISAGRQHTCALTSTGRAYCWGRNNEGQLGNGSTSDALTPVAVLDNLGFSAIAEGDVHTCALTFDGTAYCWGNNNRGEATGQLGDGTTTSRLAPTMVAGNRLFTRIRARRNFTCGLTSAGLAYCWGSNLYGQLGVGGTSPSLTPVGVGGAP